MEPRCGAGRREKLFQGHLQRGGDAVQHPQGGIGASRLEVRPGRPRQTRHARHLLLRHATGVAKLSDVGGRVAGQGIDVHANRVVGPTPLRLLLDTECEDLARVLETNLVGPFRLTRIIAGAMALHGSGVVVHLSSDAAIAAYPRWGGYGVSKAALDHLNRSWAAELPQVRFFSVDPGEMDTAMHAAAMPDADRTQLARPEDVARRIARMIAGCERIESGARVVVPP
jgi:NAD(P)-dependent dehydrogenase (short-subunit alcohol dehydrogenase family)